MENKCRRCSNVINDVDVRCSHCGYCDAARLIALLKHRSGTVRASAADAFNEIEPGQNAVRALAIAIGDADKNVRHVAAVTLFTLRGASGMVVPELVELLGSTDVVLQRLIVACLSNAGAAAKQAIPSLRLLRERSSDGLLHSWIDEAVRVIEAQSLKGIDE